jgi:hypothetical protein
MSSDNDVKTLQKISNEVLDLLGKYPEHHEVICQLMVTFTGGSFGSNGKAIKKAKDSKSSANAPPSKGGAKVEKKTYSTATSASVTIIDSPSIEVLEVSTPLAVVEPGNIMIAEFSEHKSNFALCVLSETAKAVRQENSVLPRMDHRSVKTRVTGARKATRKALKEYKTESDAGRKTYAAMCFINSMKHFRLVLNDAFKTRVDSVNIGADLLDNMVSLLDFKSLAQEVENAGYLQNEKTHFWEDPIGVGPKTSSPGSDLSIKNPFA